MTSVYDFPTETLESIFSHLLSPLPESFTNAQPFHASSDLLSIRLVSRHWHKVATPLAWRRLHISLEGRSVARSRQRFRVLRDHPELVKHIQVLSIELLWDFGRAAWRPFVGACDTLAEALKHFDTLKGVSLISEQQAPPQQILDALLELPSVEALCIKTGETVPPGSLENAYRGSSIGMLSGHILTIATLAPCLSRLESLHLDGRGSPVRSFQFAQNLPWSTLRDLTLQSFSPLLMEYVFEGFDTHRKGGYSTPLSELVVVDVDFNGQLLDKLISAFEGHPLRGLKLSHLPPVDVHAFQRLTVSFPRLVHLSLLQRDGSAWPEPLLAYANQLTELTELRTLEWNCFEFGWDYNDIFAIDSEEPLEPCFRFTALTLASCLPDLESVAFTWEKAHTMSISRENRSIRGMESSVGEPVNEATPWRNLL